MQYARLWCDIQEITFQIVSGQHEEQTIGELRIISLQGQIRVDPRDRIAVIKDGSSRQLPISARGTIRTGKSDSSSGQLSWDENELGFHVDAPGSIFLELWDLKHTFPRTSLSILFHPYFKDHTEVKSVNMFIWNATAELVDVLDGRYGELEFKMVHFCMTTAHEGQMHLPICR